jgi:membrane associated rhomboid family serine protease
MANYRSSPFSNIPLVVKNLLILNALMLFITWVIESTYGYDLTRILGLYYPGSEYFRKFQFVTHMFMHGSFWHLFLNMFALWMFGTVIENVWGPRRFFIYYMVVGLGASAFYIAVNAIQFSMISNAANEILNTASPDAFMSLLKAHFPGWYKEMLNSDAINAWYNDPHNLNYAKSAYDKVQEALTAMKNVPMVGASGAVFGVLLAFGMMFPNQPIYIYFLIPLKAKYLVIIYGLFELYAAISEPGSQVAHVAHIGGMIFGFILIKYWNRKKTNFY